jgi:hypothetical protein
MPKRTQIGNVIQQTDGDECTVYTERYANEEHCGIYIEGRAAYLHFDPSAPGGRKQLGRLIAYLIDAMAAHDHAVQEIYGNLKVGDYCIGIREPAPGESRCTWHFDGSECSRPQHEDGHHVLVDDDHMVIAVHHPAAAADAAMAAYAATQPGDALGNHSSFAQVFNFYPLSEVIEEYRRRGSIGGADV